MGFNNVFGYYIEVRNTHKEKVPSEWIRKQTLVSAERYITEELKEYESKILGAEEKILALETRLFNELILALAEYISAIQLNSYILAQTDCLLSFAQCAESYGYFRPEVNESTEIEIREGRHPVIERQLPIGESYVANDVLLNQEDQQIIIITGPNMAGNLLCSGKPPSSHCWRRWGVLSRRRWQKSDWWIKYSPAWALPTTFRSENPLSWWR